MLLHLHIFFIFAENAVPLIYNDNERPFASGIDVPHGSRQICLVKVSEIGIFFKEFPQNTSAKQIQHSVHVPALAQKLLHIQKNSVILIQIFFKAFVLCDFKGRKQPARIAFTAVIGSQHRGSHGFSETARTADAQIILHCIQHPVRIF